MRVDGGTLEQGDRRREGADGSFHSPQDPFLALTSVELMRINIEYCTV